MEPDSPEVGTGQAAAGVAPWTSDLHHIRGCVSSFRQRMEPLGNKYQTVWNFLVNRWDTHEVSQSPVSVEMRGDNFTGSVGDGDWVEIKAKWRDGELLTLKEVRNLTQNCPVKVDGGNGSARSLSGLATPMFIVAVMVFCFLATAHFNYLIISGLVLIVGFVLVAAKLISRRTMWIAAGGALLFGLANVVLR